LAAKLFLERHGDLSTVDEARIVVVHLIKVPLDLVVLFLADRVRLYHILLACRTRNHGGTRHDSWGEPGEKQKATFRASRAEKRTVPGG
jgi:hypothetical protein